MMLERSGPIIWSYATGSWQAYVYNAPKKTWEPLAAMTKSDKIRMILNWIPNRLIQFVVLTYMKRIVHRRYRLRVTNDELIDGLAMSEVRHSNLAWFQDAAHIAARIKICG